MIVLKITLNARNNNNYQKVQKVHQKTMVIREFIDILNLQAVIDLVPDCSDVCCRQIDTHLGQTEVELIVLIQ